MSSRPASSSLKRTTVMLPADLRRRAFARARERGVSLGELIRESLDASIPRAGPAHAGDPIFADDVVFSGPAPKNLSVAHDEHLYGGST